MRRAQADVQSIVEIKEEKEQKCEKLSDDSLNSYEHKGNQFHTCIYQILQLPKNREKDCLVKCFNSSMAILQYTDDLLDIPEFNDHITKLVITLFERVKSKETGQVRLSFQVMNDFKSELYRLTLLAQCMIVKSQYSPSAAKRIKLMPEQKYAAENVEEYIQKLDPHVDRIHEEKYEQLFSQLRHDAPNLADLSIYMPQFPQALKGVWRKCISGHFFCIPYVCDTKFKPCADCPDCT